MVSTCIYYVMGLKVRVAVAEFGVSGGGKISRFRRRLMELVSEVALFPHRKTGAADAFFFPLKILMYKTQCTTHGRAHHRLAATRICW